MEKKILEKTVKAAVRKRLKEIGAFQFWPVQMGLGAPTLDVLGVYKGRGYGVECKAPGKKPTLRQKFTIEEMQAAGAVVYVIDNVLDAKKIFNGESREYPNIQANQKYSRTI